MDLTPQIFTARVMHKRFFPAVNEFNYGIYYLSMPLPVAKAGAWFARFDPRDVGPRDGSDPTPFAKQILQQNGLEAACHLITLVTMPRVMGYVFNPVSFYMCYDADLDLRAVIAEVHNTFGEQHIYLCVHDDQRPITSADWMSAQKVFHVSPFLEREGFYKFRFSQKDDRLGIWIDYFDDTGAKKLATALVGRVSPLTPAALRRAFWAHPLVTMKATVLIHWQALKLVAKRIRFYSKPDQRKDRVTLARTWRKNLTKL